MVQLLVREGPTTELICASDLPDLPDALLETPQRGQASLLTLGHASQDRMCLPARFQESAVPV
eukprot:147731-Alexandrium_andersonii.AAC.1